MLHNGRRALIITPTGRNLTFDDAYDKENHWRFTKPERTYDTCVVVYKEDFEPEPGTYDFIVRRKGLKWNLIPEVAQIIKWEDYDYIGCWDDDYATDIQSLNFALDLARKGDFRAFQQAAISFNTYPCLRHNPEWLVSETNFIELGVPFFRNDIFRKVLRFLNDYKYQKSDWGIDKVLSFYLQTTFHVIHETTIKHMIPDESSYSKSDGFQEMEYLMTDFFPKYMKKNFNLDYVYNDNQITISAYRKG
jgi:hypothetical protein